MQDAVSSKFITLTRLSVLRQQDELFAFTEEPSDKYNQDKGSVAGKSPRIGALELFSLFTADIIKKEVIFTR